MQVISDVIDSSPSKTYFRTLYAKKRVQMFRDFQDPLICLRAQYKLYTSSEMDTLGAFL